MHKEDNSVGEPNWVRSRKWRARCKQRRRCHRCGKKVHGEKYKTCGKCRKKWREHVAMKRVLWCLKSLCSQGCGQKRYKESDKCEGCLANSRIWWKKVGNANRRAAYAAAKEKARAAR